MTQRSTFSWIQNNVIDQHFLVATRRFNGKKIANLHIYWLNCCRYKYCFLYKTLANDPKIKFCIEGENT